MKGVCVALVHLILTLCLAAGCSTHNTTLARSGSNGGQVIYRISEHRAFTIALAALAEVLPKQSLFDIGVASGRRGYESTWRWGLDTYSQNVLIIPAIGTDAAGHEVHGYWFDVSGEGSSGSGLNKNLELFARIQEALAATGTATAVTNVREGKYETDGSAYRAKGRDARDATPAASPPGGTGIADHLRELKMLHEQQLITDEEYANKRKQLLDRIDLRRE